MTHVHDDEEDEEEETATPKSERNTGGGGEEGSNRSATLPNVRRICRRVCCANEGHSPLIKGSRGSLRGEVIRL